MDDNFEPGCSVCSKLSNVNYVTSCGDLRLCNDCATSFIKKGKSFCSICNSTVELKPLKPEPNNAAIADDLCHTHHKKCDYFCQTCKVFLCGDCIFEQFSSASSPHKDHKIIKSNDIFDDVTTKLRSLNKRILLHIKKYESLKTQVESVYDETLISMHSCFRSIQSHANIIQKEAESDLMAIAEKNELKMEELQILIDDSDEILKAKDPQIASSALCVIEKIKRIVSEGNEPETHYPQISFVNELIPPYSSFQIEIPHFKAAFDSKTYKTTYTPPVEMFHGKWRAKIHPSQNGENSHGNLAVFVEFLSGVGAPIMIDYRVHIRHPTKEKIISRTFRSEFNEMDSWGWTKFATVESIISGGFVNKDDILNMEISLRPSSYAEYIKIYDVLLNRAKEKYRALKHPSQTQDSADETLQPE